jgi:ankyrin repeat protein
MLKHGADPTLANEVNSWTALHCFAWKGEDVDVLDLLLNHDVGGVKPDINARDCEGNTPLHVLLWRRQVPKVLLEAFMRRGANANEENLNSARPLQMACLYGDLDTLRDLCHSNVITEIDHVDNDGDTALQQAVVGNHTNCVKFLVEFGANPNVANNSGKAALHKAAFHSTRDCIELLLNHGATPNKLDNDKRTPLFCACVGASATEDKAIFLLDTLLGMKVPLSEINCLTNGHRTPLREAAGHGFEYVVEKLIKVAEAANDFASLALDVPDGRKGMTPLHRAARLGKTGCLRLLLEANADVTLWTNDGKTALTLANEQWALASHHEGYEEILSLLIDADTEAAAADPELVAVCAMNGSLRLLQKLANIGADLNCQDKYGWTPIELATKPSAGGCWPVSQEAGCMVGYATIRMGVRLEDRYRRGWYDSCTSFWRKGVHLHEQAVTCRLGQVLLRDRNRKRVRRRRRNFASGPSCWVLHYRWLCHFIHWVATTWISPECTIVGLSWQ